MPSPSPQHAHDPSLVALGTAIRKARLARGISQEELASRSAVDRSYMSSIERGQQNPGFVSVLRIARAMDMTAAELIARDQPRSLAGPYGKPQPNARQRLAQRVRACRMARSMSQQELAKRSGLHASSVGAIERARTNVSIDTVERLATALGLDIIELLRSET